MSTTKFKPGDLVRITTNTFNGEGLVKGDIVEVAENISSSPQEFTSIIMPSGKVLSWFNYRFKKIDSWTNTSRGLDGYKYYVKDGRVWVARHGRTLPTILLVSDLAPERERFVKNPAIEVSEHGFTVGQRLYTTNSQWPEIDFVGESTFNDKPYVKGIHSVWGVAGHFHLSEVSATAPEELPPVSRKHFDESKAAGERRRQKLITHVEELQAKLSEKNKVIAQREATLRSIRNLVV